MVIYEALTGQLPYLTGKNLTELCPDAPVAMQELLEQCLKPNPADRPASSVEVYARLQEMNKTIDLSMPSAAAVEALAPTPRAANTDHQAHLVGQPTEIYHTMRRSVVQSFVSKLQNRRLRGVLFALGVIALIMLFKYVIFPGPTPQTPGKAAKILGVAIGDDENAVVEKLQLGDLLLVPAWDGQDRPAYLGHLLAPEDFCLSDDQVKKMHVRKSSNQHTCVLFNEGKVIGLVTMDTSAATLENVRLGEKLGKLTEIYPNLMVGDPDPKNHMRLCRDAANGLGFEIEELKVKTMVLYPPLAGP